MGNTWPFAILILNWAEVLGPLSQTMKNVLFPEQLHGDFLRGASLPVDLHGPCVFPLGDFFFPISFWTLSEVGTGDSAL